MPLEVLDQSLMKDAFDADPLSTRNFSALKLCNVNLQATTDLCIQVVGETDFLNQQFFGNRLNLTVYRFTVLL